MHDYLLAPRGAERTFLAIADQWPSAPIRTLLYEPAAFEKRLRGHVVKSSALQRLPFRQRGFRRLLPLFPPAAERLDVAGRRLVVSSSSAFAHGVHPDPGAIHVAYCHSPFRYIWHETGRLTDGVPKVTRPALPVVLAWLRRWDRAAVGRVTHLVANSSITQARIAEFWGRRSTVIHPPVETSRFSQSEPEGYALMVGELVEHKRVGIGLEAAGRAKIPVKVVGTGPDEARLRAQFPEAQFLGRIDDRALADVYARALVMLMPNVEEFGIAGVEAQAAGRPVLAVGEGGATETIVDGVTGVLVPGGDVDSMAEALREIDFRSFDSARIVEHAGRFSVEAFKARFSAEVRRAWLERR